MIIKEFRIVMPLSVEEYRIGQLYTVAEASKNETGGGEGVVILRNEPFSNYPLLGDMYSEGQYTLKKYYLSSKVPLYIRFLAPKKSLEVTEEAWNSYPYCRTVITNPEYMGADFRIVIETMHSADKGDTYNIHQLSEENLQLRELETIDIAEDLKNGGDYLDSEDPTKIRSEKCGRGPLVKGEWMDTCEPVMTCYKLFTCEFKKFGLQSIVESYINALQERIFVNFHRQMFCWLDKWFGKTMDDMRLLEEQTQEELLEELMQGSVRGMKSI